MKQQHMIDRKMFRDFHNGVECLFTPKINCYEVRPLRSTDRLNPFVACGQAISIPFPTETDDIAILQSETYKDAFPGLSDQDIIYSQHALILSLKKEVSDLREQLYGHNEKCLNQNY